MGTPGLPAHRAYPKPNKDGDGVRQGWELAIPKIWICSSPSDNQDSFVGRVSTWRPGSWGGLFPPTCLQPAQTPVWKKSGRFLAF